MGKLIAIAKRASSGAPMIELDRARLTVEKGVEDDLRGKVGPRQVTVLSLEAWREACREIGESDLSWTVRRANLLVSGLDLRESTGGHLRLGGAILKITGETDPCIRMEQARAGLMSALAPAWRGGVTCRVRSSGLIEVGDEVSLEAAPGG